MKTKSTKRTITKAFGGANSRRPLDPNKLSVRFCSAAVAEQIAKMNVLRDLRQRAKSAGKRIRGGTENLVGPQRCDARWLFATLQQMGQEFAAEIDEDLDKLNKPDADREDLVGHIYTVILCIRATNTIFFGDGH